MRERVIGAANRYPEITSRYFWKDECVRAREFPLLLKTRAELFSRVAERVRELHPYETPSIQQQDVADVNPEYLAWLYEQTEGATNA